MGLKDLFLQKGWAGRTLTREETVDRLNPLIEQHARLYQAYNYAIDQLSDEALVSGLKEQQKTARTDIAKLKETVLSAGGVPFNGIGLKEQEELGQDDALILRELIDREEQFNDALASELEDDHQMHTRAILSVVRNNSNGRLNELRRASRSRR